ncbi:MAG: DUF2306 domain-containing protein [Bacteroidia bacterium]|nr:DUF2306 domain-containing protein [Bacteroidia bacterium]
MTTYWKTGLLYLGAIVILILSIHYFQYDDTGIMSDKDIASESWYRICLRMHIGFGMIAIFLGPVQFIQSFRNKYLKTHRQLGYVYFGSVVVSSMAGLISAQYAMGGWISALGFSILAILWFVSTTMAFMAIANKEIEKHQKRMYISYGLTFTAITQRTMLLIPMFVNIEFISIYQLSAWLPWIINIAVALYFYNRLQLTKA